MKILLHVAFDAQMMLTFNYQLFPIFFCCNQIELHRLIYIELCYRIRFFFLKLKQNNLNELFYEMNNNL